jgi:hypothetical protein
LKDIGITRSEIWAAAQRASHSRPNKARSENLRRADINASNWQHCTGIARAPDLKRRKEDAVRRALAVVRRPAG